jgi:transposase
VLGTRAAQVVRSRAAQQAPIAAEAVKRIDVLFANEREINGLAPHERLRVRQERSRPLIIEPQTWLREQPAKL